MELSERMLKLADHLDAELAVISSELLNAHQTSAATDVIRFAGIAIENLRRHAPRDTPAPSRSAAAR